MISESTSRAWLIPLPSGIPLEPLVLAMAAKNKNIVIGRSQDCDLPLPVQAEEVSRRHAEFVAQGGRWGVADLGSRWGTLVNGVKIEPRRLVPLGEGDLIRIHPWSFRFSTRSATSDRSAAIEEDSQVTVIRTLDAQAGEPLRHDLLNLLLEASSTIQSVSDEIALAKILADMARRGTGLNHAVVLRALDAQGNVEAILDAGKPAGAAMRFSRSLLTAAARGVVAEYSADSDLDVSQSIIQSNVRAAVCAPILLGNAVAAYLYVDSQGGAGRALLRPNASAFCQALTRMGGLALANLKRLEIEHRAARLEAELVSAAAAQQWILPRAPITAGRFSCVGQSRPGGYLGGDFFDAQVLPGGCLAVSLGDVSGHDAAASVLMTAAQGFLHASLAGCTDLERVIGRLNDFIHLRCPPGKFITLWTGVFDPSRMTLTYVDAGHGYALLLKADGSFQKLSENGGLPIAMDPSSEFRGATVPLENGQRVLVVSDGIIEQDQEGSERASQQFGLEGVEAAVQTAGETELLDHLFQKLFGFAGGTTLADDATAVLVRWAE